MGMLIFLAITFLVAQKLYSQKNAVLLASFVGINLMNLLLHTWTDTATAWTWWLLAGVSLGQIALSKPLKRSRRVTS